MYHYRFDCTNKDDILFRINQIVIKDFPHGKTLFGSYLYKSGIHFEEYGNRIKGFIASLVLFFFAKGYYDMMNDTFNILNRIFK